MKYTQKKKKVTFTCLQGKKYKFLNSSILNSFRSQYMAYNKPFNTKETTANN